MRSKKNGLLGQGIMLTAAAVIVSVVSFLKEAIFARYFGVSGVSDAYTIAIQVPEMLFAIVWETISAVVIPLYTNKLHTEGTKEANHFFSNILTLVCLLSALLISCGELFSSYIVGFLFPGISLETRSLAAEILRWTLPVLFFEGIIRVVTGILHVHGQFLIPKILNTVRNFGVIVFLILFTRNFGIYAAVTGVLTGFIIESVLFLCAANRYEQYTPRVDLKDPALKVVVSMAIPLLLGVGVRELNQIVDKMVASFLDAGSISSLHYAFKLSTMIENTLLGSVAVLLYPRYSMLAAKNEKKQLSEEYQKTVKICIVFGIPIILGGIFLSQELVSVAFEGGIFDKRSVIAVSTLFSIYLASSIFTTITGVTVKLFTACCDTKVPAVNAAIGVAINIVLNILLSHFLGVTGLAAATTIAAIMVCIRLFFMVRKRIYRFGLKPITETLFKSIFSGIMMFVGLFFIKTIVLRVIPLTSMGEKLIFCVMSALVGAIVYGGVLALTKAEEVGFLLDMIKKGEKSND